MQRGSDRTPVFIAGVEQLNNKSSLRVEPREPWHDLESKKGFRRTDLTLSLPKGPHEITPLWFPSLDGREGRGG
jgi:hypothetical protein